MAARHYAAVARKQNCFVLASAAAVRTKKFPARTNAISEQSSEVLSEFRVPAKYISFSCTVSYRSKLLSFISSKFSDQADHILQVTSFDDLEGTVWKEPFYGRRTYD